ncbi:MAG: BspA family leucine-rich repeat surface protein [Bacteroidales bacterium]|nr:BspA family leucine-rich repeat surface protein [Bacteroidales bacterium]
MKKALFAMAFAALFAVGCQISDFAPDMKKELKVFTGTIADDATRAALLADGDIYHVTWSLNDRIMINDEYEFTATVGDATTTYFVQDTTGARPDDPPTGPYKAVYPFSVGRGMPGVQNYVAGGVEIIPMYAESDNENLSFKNMIGILKLNVKTGETGVVVKKIVMTADQPMSGEYEVVNNAAVVSGTAGVTVNCGEGVAIGADPVPFFVTVPANTYTGMTIKVYTTDGKVASVKMKSGASVTVERSKYYEADFSFNGFTPIEGVGGVALLPSGPDFNTIIKQVVTEDELATYATIDETNVTRIVFNTLSAETEGLEIQDLSSDKPVYLVYDKASGVVSINTPAEKLKTPADASYMFAYFGSMKYIDNLKCLDTEDAELMNHMFCLTGGTNRELRELDLSNFNTSNVTNMRSMFNGLRNVTSLDVSSFDTSNVEEMTYMFQYCINLKELDLSNFNTEMVESMSYMFGYCYALENLNVSSFNTENCLNLGYMFYYCESLINLDLSSFNTENATNLGRIFQHCHNLLEVKTPNFSFASATEVRSFYNRCDAIQKIDVSMLEGCENFTSSSTTGYFFWCVKSLRELYCGDVFHFSTRPTQFFSATNSSFEMRPGSVFGGFTIYCDQDIADWFATTGLRWLPVGYNSDGVPTDPIPVTFKHYKTGNELQVEWSAP